MLPRLIFLWWFYYFAIADEDMGLGLYNEAVNCHTTGDHLCALTKYRAALEEFPDLAQAHQNMGMLYESGLCNDLIPGGASEGLSLALHHHRQSILYSSRAGDEFSVGAWCNLISLEMRLVTIPGVAPDTSSLAAYSMFKNPEELLEAYHGKSRFVFLADQLATMSSKMAAPDANVLFTMGKLFLELRSFGAALDVFLQILQIEPDHAMALLNVGNQYFRTDRFEEASQFYIKTVQVLKGLAPEQRDAPTHLPNVVMALNNLGQSFRQMGRLDEAIETIESAILLMDEERKSSGRAAVFDLGLELWSSSNVYAMRGLGINWGRHFEDLEAFLEHAVEQQSLDPLRYVAPSLSGGGIIDPYTFSLQRFASRKVDLQTSQIYCQPFLPLAYNPVDHQDFQEQQQQRKVNVGYLSYDWRDHPMGRLTSRFVTSHNRSRLSATCLSYGPNDGSSVRRHVQFHAQRFIDIEAVKNDEEASAAIRALGLDVLVDLTAHTYNGRVAIAALKPAAIVINYLGFPGSTGCRGFDFSMVDAAVVPPEVARELFSERLLYLPGSYQANSMPLTVPLCHHAVQRGQGGAQACRLRVGQEEQGWNALAPFSSWGSDDRVWLCSFNANKKIEPIAFSAWMNIMRENPRAVLLLLDLNEAKKRHLLNHAAFHGVSASRLVFIPSLPWTQHLFRSASCDLVLDTFVYGAHTTSSDALWMSVPLLALESWGSGRMPSRVAAAISSSLFKRGHGVAPSAAAGVTVASSVREYEKLAHRLTRYREKVSLLRSVHAHVGAQGLRAATFNAKIMQSSLELAFQAAVDAQSLHRKGVLPALPHIFLTFSQQLRPAASAFTSASEGEEGDAAQRKDALKVVGSCLARRAMATALSLKKAAAAAAAAAQVTDESTSTAATIANDGTVAAAAEEAAVSVFLSATTRDSEDSSGCSEADVAAVAGRVLLSFPQVSTAPSLRQLAAAPSSREAPCAGLASAFVHAALNRPPSALSAFSSTALLPLLKTHVSKCLFSQPHATVKALLEEQFALIERCEEEKTVFDAVAPLLFEATQGWQFATARSLSPLPSPSLQEGQAEAPRSRALSLSIPLLLAHMPLVFNNESRGWASLSPALVLAVQAIPDPSAAEALVSDAAMVLNNHAVCVLPQARGGGDASAAVAIASAMVIAPSGQRLTDLGIAVEPLDPNLGYQLASNGALVMHAERFSRARLAEKQTMSQKQSQKQRLKQRQKEKERKKHRRSSRSAVTVALFCFEYGNEWWGQWGPSSLEPGGGGLGGSEEAVVYLAEELSGLGGFEVTVYADPPEGDLRRGGGRINGVTYKRHSDYDLDDDDPPDVFISWRYSFSLALGRRSKLRLLWLHDLVQYTMLPPPPLLLTPRAAGAGGVGDVGCDAILVQSTFHKDFIVEQLVQRGHGETESRNLVSVLPNGLSSRRDPKWKSATGTNARTTLVYGSSPSRGLEGLLERAWPVIYAQARDQLGLDLRLRVLYGFPVSVQQQYRKTMGPERFASWLERMTGELLTQPGVEYVGSVDHARLAAEYAAAGFVLYPTAFAETGCITILKAMACGAVPVTSRFVGSVLPNLTAGWDLGPARQLQYGDDLGHWLLHHYVPAVLQAVNSSIEIHRKEMIKNARTNHLWSASAKILEREMSDKGVTRRRRHLFFWWL